MVCHAGHLPSRTGCEESAGPTRGIQFHSHALCYPHGKKRKVRELVPVVHNLIFIHITQTDMKELKKDIPYLQYMTDSRSGEKIIVPDGQMRDFIAVAGTYDEHLLFFKPEEINPAKGTRVRIIGGDFAGYEGIFIKVKGARDRRVVICIQGIIAMAMATISPDLIEVIKEPKKK